MPVKELIEQIGRERLELFSEYAPNQVKGPVTFREVKMMARALLAVLDAKPVGTVSIVQDLYSIPRRNIATVNMRPDLVVSEMRDGDNLYTTPPAASVPDGWKLVPLEPTQRMIDAHIEGMVIGGATRAYRDMLAAAPAPGGDGGDQG